MRPVTPAFLSTVRSSHVMIARAHVLTAFQTGTAPTGVIIPILSGSVTLDCTANVRSSLDLSTDGTSMWPESYGTGSTASQGNPLLLAPYGNEIFIERGVDYGGGSFEWCSLGYFRIETAEQQQVPDGPIRITGKDRMQGIIAARLLAPRQFVPTDTYGAVARSLVQDVYPLAQIEWDDNTDMTQIGRAIAVESDRFAALTDLVTSAAKVCWWDYRGVLVIKALPDDTTPVSEVDAGAGGVLISVNRSLSREGMYNAVVATGEGPDEGVPVRGVATDDNPNSPTYYLGRFGPEPRFYSSPLLRTNAAALAAAQTILAKATGLPYKVDFGVVPNPALEPYDCVRVTYADADELHVIESLTVPLIAADSMTAKTRQMTWGRI